MMKISRQAVYQKRQRDSRTQAQVLDLLPRVRALRQLMPRVGTRKLLKHLGEPGVGRDKFFEILCTHGLLVKRRRRYAITTDSTHGLPVYPNLMPDAVVDAPNRVWVADQTYIRLRHGFCYLSLVTDLYTRKIVGYDVDATLEAQGAVKALEMAFSSTANVHGLLHHSDQGKQYASHQYTSVLKDHGCRISMSARRRPDQNAVAERVNGILKSEFYLDATFSSIEDVRTAVTQSIHIYNNIRLHTSLGMTTPSRRYAA